jgi:ketosteroid isomerase-like protein
MHVKFWMAWMLVMILTAAPVKAQSGTPATDPEDAASCSDVTPRDAAFFQGLAATPAAQKPSGTAEANAANANPAPFTMPEGDAADEAVVAAVATLYQQFVSCLNTKDYQRVYALYSEDYLVRNLTQEAITSLAATPVPTEEAMQTRFGGVLDARLLEDGHIAALVSTSNPQSGEVVFFAILRRNGDQLQIDEEQVVELAAASPASEVATPASG